MDPTKEHPGGEKPASPLRSSAYPAVFAHYLPLLRNVAREHGYGLGVHGSMARDMDLMAVPWADDAKDAQTLIAAFCEATGGVVPAEQAEWDAQPALRAHGRRAWSIYLNPEHADLRHGPYLDISVMPRSCDWATLFPEETPP